MRLLPSAEIEREEQREKERQRGRGLVEGGGPKWGEWRRNQGECNKEEQGQKNTGGDEDNGTVHL